MRNIIKVNNIQDAKDNPIRPLLAMDANGNLFGEGQAAGPQIEFVDFGLPSGTLWATKNIGATNGNTAESWYGDYYAWGEIETKTYYDWTDSEDAAQNYKYAKGSSNTLTKYCNMSGQGYEEYIDELIQLVSSDDVATVTNSAWRMPTEAEIQELLAGTSNSWVENYNDIEGLNGRVFTGTNGNTLFMPAAGFRDGSDIRYAGSYCYLWSSSLFLNYPYRAYGLSFNSYDFEVYNHYNRCYGFSVRPVC